MANMLSSVVAKGKSPVAAKSVAAHLTAAAPKGVGCLNVCRWGRTGNEVARDRVRRESSRAVLVRMTMVMKRWDISDETTWSSRAGAAGLTDWSWRSVRARNGRRG